MCSIIEFGLENRFRIFGRADILVGWGKRWYRGGIELLGMDFREKRVRSVCFLLSPCELMAVSSPGLWRLGVEGTNPTD